MTVEIVAEAGINHQNDLATAHRLIDEAKAAGADVVKFQASVPELEVSRRAAPEHYALIKALVPSREFLVECKRHCEEIGVEFLCTPAEEDSLAWLVATGVKRIKVASDNLTNGPFLNAVFSTGLPVILSTGMADVKEIADVLLRFRDRDLVALHCTSAYPCPTDEANLLMVRVLTRWAKRVGWSDHTTSTTLPAVAVGLGAVMIEKHITLDRNAPGPDHAASLEPWQFKAMVENIREAEVARGDGQKWSPMPSEQETFRVARKSLVAAHNIAAGGRFGTDNLAIKRPGTGIPASRWGEWIGKVADRDYEEDELIA